MPFPTSLSHSGTAYAVEGGVPDLDSPQEIDGTYPIVRIETSSDGESTTRLTFVTVSDAELVVRELS